MRVLTVGAQKKIILTHAETVMGQNSASQIAVLRSTAGRAGKHIFAQYIGA